MQNIPFCISVTQSFKENIESHAEIQAELGKNTYEDSKKSMMEYMMLPCGETKVEVLVGYERRSTGTKRYYKTLDLTGLTVAGAILNILDFYKKRGDCTGDYNWIEGVHTDNGKRYLSYGS